MPANASRGPELEAGELSSAAASAGSTTHDVDHLQYYFYAAFILCATTFRQADIMRRYHEDPIAYRPHMLCWKEVSTVYLYHVFLSENILSSVVKIYCWQSVPRWRLRGEESQCSMVSEPII